MSAKTAVIVVAGLTICGPSWGQGNPAEIPALVRGAAIEGVALGMTRAEASAILIANGYEAEPRPAAAAAASPRGYRAPCSQPSSTDADKFSTPVVKAKAGPGGTRPSGLGAILNPYVSRMSVSFSCDDEKVVHVSRQASAHWEASVAVPRASEQRFFEDAKLRYEALCPAPAESNAAAVEHFRTGSISEIRSGRIECSRGQSRLGAKYQKADAGMLYDYTVGLQANAKNATYIVEVSIYPEHGK